MRPKRKRLQYKKEFHTGNPGKNYMEDKAYIRQQIKTGKPVDNNKLKAGKIAIIDL